MTDVTEDIATFIVISIKALLISNRLIHLTRNMYIISVTSVTPDTLRRSERQVMPRLLDTVGHHMPYVGGGTLEELPETAMVSALLLDAHVLQCLAHLHSREAHLSAKACHDVRCREIHHLLVSQWLAVAGGDEFAGDVGSLVSAVATVETGNLVGVKPIAESRVEKMTYL